MAIVRGEGEECMKQWKIWVQPCLVLAALAALFVFLFYADNKYQTPPPYGRSGVIELNGQDLERDTPIFLIDGWLLTDARVTDMPTYIGEFSNLQRGDWSVSPHGQARYRMTLRYDGTPRIVSVDFWQLAAQYDIFLDEMQIASGTGSGRITFLLTPGDHLLEVETLSERGYYSGMYFPPALGRVETIAHVGNVQSLAYALAFILPLALAAFTLFLWRTGGRLGRWFALLCCCYALYMFRYFVFLFSMPVAQYWFLAQNAAFYGMCCCVVKLTSLASNAETGKAWQWMRVVLFLLPMVLFLLCLLIPVWPPTVSLHGRLMDFYYMLTFLCTVFFAARGIVAGSWESRYTQAGCAIFGAGLFANLLCANRFEPIRFFWQFEWCGLLLVLLFGAMMVSRSRRILRENDALTNHLEEQVKERTQEVMQLLNERKAFFSDMAHDLKAPVFATQSFINAIRESGVGVDDELRGYLDQAQAKQQEMARRLQGLSAINALDKIEEERTRVSLKETLAEIYALYHGEAEVRSVYFFVNPPDQDAFLTVQPQKLDMLFENLIYNALRATPPNGSITISACIEDGKIRVTVEDTGCGIPKEEQPYIFQRFYVGANNKASGTGLGLYIVQSIVAELGGTIAVRSAPGSGTAFMMEFLQDG